jgi:hypothetical protein
MSLRDQILAADDIVTEIVKVPEWGVDVEVRSMTGAERTRILDLAMADDGEMNLQTVYPEVVIASAFEPPAEGAARGSGAQIFTPEDREALQQKNAVAVDRLAQVGLRLGGFTQESADAVGKDSSATPEGDSSSG